MAKRALISVSDKTGVVDFASELIKLGYEIISTGGTAKALKEVGLPVIGVSQITGFPECLDGRVKTIHPNIHAGILAMRSNPEHMEQLEKLNVTPIDIVAINLYPFKQTIQKEGVTLEEAIENIDIGGPTAIRAAAKNWQDVAVLVDPSDYAPLLEEIKKGSISLDTKQMLSYKVFEHTAHYDALIANYLRNKINAPKYPQTLTMTYEKAQDMRYGENPHQSAAFYTEPGMAQGTISAAKQLHGKELSYNNINDANAAVELCREYSVPAAVAVKHANPCGVAIGETIYEAYVRAYNADPVSIFGGIVALNREVDLDTANELSKIFLEIIIAPSYSQEALDVLTKKKNIRLLTLDMAGFKPGMELKKVSGGLLIQDLDTEQIEEIKVVTKRQPTDKEMEELLFAWNVVKYVKSNGIALAKDNATVGIGPGQTNRITALELAIKYAGENCKGSVMASDAFFPFDDCVTAAVEAGITAIIQPGGSIRDEDSIKKCDEMGIAMIFTGMRHFRH